LRPRVKVRVGIKVKVRVRVSDEVRVSGITFKNVSCQTSIRTNVLDPLEGSRLSLNKNNNFS